MRMTAPIRSDLRDGSGGPATQVAAKTLGSTDDLLVDRSNPSQIRSRSCDESPLICIWFARSETKFLNGTMTRLVSGAVSGA